MSDFVYRLVYALGRPIFWITSRPLILHPERARRTGGWLLAANHLSFYDVPALMIGSSRPLDFLSITTLRDKPVVGSFFRAMNCLFLDRSRADPSAVKAIVNRLRQGRVVAMFPEGSIQQPHTAAIRGGAIKPGAVRVAQMAQVPLVPCVVLGGRRFYRFRSWLPLRAVRLGVAFGAPIDVSNVPDPSAARAVAMDRLRNAWIELADELYSAGVPVD